MDIKLTNSCFLLEKRFLKIIMKTFIFLSCAIVFALTPEGVISQNLKIKVEQDKILTVDEVFELIMDQTDYKFIYEKGIFDDLPKVEVKKGSIRINELLKRSLSQGNLDIKITGNNAILIKEKSAESLVKTQQFQVSGVVKDEAGQPLPGANIIEKGTTNGAQTDFDGNFSIDLAEEEAILVVSYVGFLTQEITVNGRSNINIVLKENTALLDEVVVIGYGTVKKSDLTGAVSSVSAKDFEKQPILRVEDALQGRASGVQVIKNSGAPGSEISIRVRGANSINGNNQPLIVIDGIIGADLRSLNTNDIASMEILKDASSTAVYGSRGANGVVLITTKKGKGKPNINVDVFGSVSSVTKKIDLLTAQEFGAINNLPVINGGTDYQDEFFQTGYTQNVQVSLSGKEEKVGYFISGNAIDQKGVSINSNYKRYSLRSNLDAKFNDRFKVSLNLSGSSEKALNLINNGRSSSVDNRGGIVAILGWDPTLPIIDSNGNYNLSSANGSGLINPIAVRRESDANTTINRATANLTLSYDITNNLNLTVIGGMLYGNILNENYFGVPAGSALSNPRASGNTTSATTLQNSNILTWSKSFKDHNLKVTGLFEVQKFTTKRLIANSGEYNIPGNFQSMNLGANPSIRSSLSRSEIHSYMGRAEYNHNQKLFLTGTMRIDVSSRFRSGNQAGYFPSGTVAYQFNDLFNGVVNRFKVRVGYGEVGNQAVSPYSTYNTLTTGINYPIDGTNEPPGIALGPIANRDLKWETTRQTNIGFDARFLKGKIDLSVNKYWKNTTDLLLDDPLPDYAGGENVTRNVGEVFNGGWEFDIQSNIISTDAFSWSANLVYSYNGSEVKSLAKGRDEIAFSPFNIANVTGDYIRLKEGEPLGQFWGATALGTYKTGDTDGTPGDARYLEDANGTVLSVIGNGIPKSNWALNQTFTWGNFDVNILLRGVHGFDVLNVTRARVSLPGGVQSRATYGEYRNRWTPQNQTNIPAGGNLLINSSRFVEKGDFIRLDNLALGYNIKENKLFSSMRIYASAQNLFTITDYSGYDPESSSLEAGEGAAGSIDNGANPNTRTFSLGVKLGF
jgi:TonB-linked SusC/RagA family outer membrane protein